MFIHQISWVVLKFRWQKFEQNRKAKALQPAASCCTRFPPGRSGSALTCSFSSKELSCRDLGDLPTRLGLEKMPVLLPHGRSVSQSLTFIITRPRTLGPLRFIAH